MLWTNKQIGHTLYNKYILVYCINCVVVLQVGKSMYGIVCIYKLCYSTKVYSSITTRYVIVCFTYVL